MAQAEVKSLAFAPRRAWVGPRGKLLVGVVVGIALTAGLLEVFRVSVGQNFHTVIPGQVFRCAQQSGPDLEAMVREHGIRTVVNLRGYCTGFPWYEEESQATCRLDICQEDINLSAGRFPSTSEMRRLVEVLEHTEYPILLHCRRGADRTGLTAAVVLLLLTDDSLPQAQSQLGLRYGHLALGRPAILGEFFTLYTDWLRAGNQTHSRQSFRQWLLEEYRAGPCRAHVERCSSRPLEAPRGRSLAVQIKATNQGTAAWHIKPSVVSGIHFGLFVWDDQDRNVVEEKFGYFQATVAPGESIAVTAVIPPLGEPGRYRLRIDLIEEGHCWFSQAGSEPLELELLVHE